MTASSAFLPIASWRKANLPKCAAAQRLRDTCPINCNDDGDSCNLLSALCQALF